MSLPVVLEQDNPLVPLRKQRNDVRGSVAGHVTYLEANGARTGIQNLPGVARSIVLVESESPTIVAEFADEKFVHPILVEVELLHEHGPEQRVEQNFGGSKRIG